jgi:hypothetical protein
MPGQRSTVGQRASGSWLPRLTGIAVIVLLAAGGVTGYLVTVHPASAHPAAPLPTKVISYQTVGLVGQNSQSGSSTQLLQLRVPAAGPQFSLIAPAELLAGSGQWTADLMAGNSYIFIFLPTGSCLSQVGTARQPVLALRHCNLQASQRWRRTGPAVLSQGHDFYEYANLSDSACLTETSELPGSVWGASLSACSTSGAVDQLIAFWWASA